MLLLALQTVQDISKKVLREVLEHVKTLLETEKKFNLKSNSFIVYFIIFYHYFL
jgi:hypothetical protein